MGDERHVIDVIEERLIKDGTHTWEQLAVDPLDRACGDAAHALALLRHEHGTAEEIIEEAIENCAEHFGDSVLQRLGLLLGQLAGEIAEITDPTAY